MNQAEAFCKRICEGSFLSFWSFANPKRKDNKKELTDLLIVCDPYVILISVKAINISKSGDPTIDNHRWYNRAVEKSYKQLYGAERIITDKITPIMTSEMDAKIDFPPKERMQLFRVGVSLGRRQSFALPFGRFESRFVHFFDQVSFPIIVDELDTVVDFVNYLTDKERFFDSEKAAKFNSEEDLLSVYLHRGRKLPDNLDNVYIAPFTWEAFSEKPEYHRRKHQENKSYVWDRIIEEFFLDYSKGELLFSSKYVDIENSLRAMAKETRFSRMVLSDVFLEFVGVTAEPKAHARLTQSINNTVYVFLLDEHREDNREERIRELALRCTVARLIYDPSPEVVGIATNPYIRGEGYSYDLYYLYIPELKEDERLKIQKIQKDLGYFTKPVETGKSYDEYPEE